MYVKLSESEIMGIINQLGIQYEDRGSHIVFSCINPERHKNGVDRHPSMSMIKANGYCKCWSCGIRYNFSSFLHQFSNKKIADFVDINVYDRKFVSTLTTQESRAYFDKNPERQLRTISGNLKQVKNNLLIKDFLASINIFDEAIKKFNIQYIDDWTEISFNPEGDGTKVCNRIVIPVYDEDNKLVNLECRDFTGKQSKKVIYPKGSKADLLFNWNNVDKDKPIIAVEGIKSVMKIWSYFDKNVVSTFGSSLGKYQSKLIADIKHLRLFPDNDKAGIGMIKQVDKLMERDYEIILMSKDGYDPADGTIDELKYALDNRVASVDNMLSKYGLDTNTLASNKIKRWS